MSNTLIKHNLFETENVCSVCIATFKRPELLRKLIQSLFNQKNVNDIRLEIIVVDNDKDESAKDIINEFINTSLVTISYYKQPIQNISLTRNLALDKSTGKYLAFIDDDETADDYWVANLINSIERFNADAVFGYIIPVFDSNVPIWMKQREIYFKPMGQTGDPPLFRYTTNCLIKADTVKKNNIRFDPNYGLSGGEDGFFFDAMQKINSHFVVCREAISYEFIPAYRTTLRFTFSRFFQRGNNFGLNKIEVENNKFQKTRVLLFIKSIIAILFFGFQSIILLPNKKKWIFSFIRLSLNLGKLSAVFGKKFFIYKNEYKLTKKK